MIADSRAAARRPTRTPGAGGPPILTAAELAAAGGSGGKPAGSHVGGREAGHTAEIDRAPARPRPGAAGGGGGGGPAPRQSDQQVGDEQGVEHDEKQQAEAVGLVALAEKLDRRQVAPPL